MSSISSQDARDYLAGLSAAGQFEIEELRRAPVELKLKQIWTLMHAGCLHEDARRRDEQVAAVRERWAQLARALHV